MEDKEKLMEEYYNVKFIGDVLFFLIAITATGCIMSGILVFVGLEDSQLLIIQKISTILLALQIIVVIFLSIIHAWFESKEESLKEKLGVKEDVQTNGDKP